MAVGPQLGGRANHDVGRCRAELRGEGFVGLDEVRDILRSAQRREGGGLGGHDLRVTGESPCPFERLFELAAMIAQHVQRGAQVVPIHPPAAGKPAVGAQGGEGVHRVARPAERHGVLREQVERFRGWRESRHRARRLERFGPVPPARRQHPGEVVTVERRQPSGVPLHATADGVRRRVVPEVHVRVRREDQRQLERRVLRRRALEAADRAGRVELDEPVQPRDELLVGKEVRRLTGGRGPPAQPGVEQGGQRRHHPLAHGLHRAQRPRLRRGYGIERAQDLPVPGGSDLDLEADAVSLPVVDARDHCARPHLAAEGPDAGGVEVPRPRVGRAGRER